MHIIDNSKTKTLTPKYEPRHSCKNVKAWTSRCLKGNVNTSDLPVFLIFRLPFWLSHMSLCRESREIRICVLSCVCGGASSLPAVSPELEKPSLHLRSRFQQVSLPNNRLKSVDVRYLLPYLDPYLGFSYLKRKSYCLNQKVCTVFKHFLVSQPRPHYTGGPSLQRTRNQQLGAQASYLNTECCWFAVGGVWVGTGCQVWRAIVLQPPSTRGIAYHIF